MDVATIARREFGEAPSRVERVAEGLVHETYEVDCAGGEYVVQFANPGEDRTDALRRGMKLYALLADSAVPVPRVVTDPPGEFDGRAYVVVERLPGETGTLDLSPGRVRNAGRCLARLHDAASFERPGRIHFEDGTPTPTVREFEAGSHADWIRSTVAESVATLRNADEGLPDAGDALGRAFDRSGTALPEGFDPVPCHDDFSPDNLLFRGDEVTGVLDFDRAYAGHRQRDLARAATGFWMHDPCADWDVRGTLYEGYRSVADPGDGFGTTEPLYRVDTLADTIAGMLRAGELSASERGFYADRIRAAVERIDGG